MPTRWQAFQFAWKSRVLQLRRAVIDWTGGPAELGVVGTGVGRVVAESRSLLYPSEAAAEFALQAGKVQNLRVVARCLNGRRIRAGEVFSFWKHVPRPTAGAGFAVGREVRQGCVIPTMGGGICQVSNALYQLALDSGFEIVERHGHSRMVSGSNAIAGRDATLFWNYLDLRFRPRQDCVLQVELTRSELVVRIWSESPQVLPPVLGAPAGALRPAESCETCGVEQCFRHESMGALVQQGVTAWLVDAWWPEHDKYLRAQRRAGDVLLAPLTRAPYRWPGDGLVLTEPWFVLRRSWRSRRLAREGAARRRAGLEMDRELAERYARRIPVEALHVVVSQNLLPHLWRAGVLAGRTFDVLMTRLPMWALQAQLDRAAERWPGTPTLSDFRADMELVAAEAAALAEARQWVTPHAGIARLAGGKALRLDWQLPQVAPARRGSTIVFPSSTLSRKGAWELREALRDSGARLRVVGGVVEEPGFWDRVELDAATGDWLDGAGVVVLPAWVEHEPRLLLRAIAAKVPVIATEACGLDGTITVAEGDVDALRAALKLPPLISTTNRLS